MSALSRRGFISSLAGLAAVAITVRADGIAAALSETDQQRLVRMMKTGHISRQTFRLEGLVVISLDRPLWIDQCTFFLIDDGSRPAVTIANRYHNVKITDCVIDIRVTNKGVVAPDQLFAWPDSNRLAL